MYFVLLHIVRYGLTFNFPQQSKKHLTSRSVVLTLRKKESEQEYWPRLTKDKVKNAYIKTDFSKWVDEDEQEGTDHATALEDDMGGMPGGMGGMGGMPGGMGGMGGMGIPGLGDMGMGGDNIDFSKVCKVCPQSNMILTRPTDDATYGYGWS